MIDTAQLKYSLCRDCADLSAPHEEVARVCGACGSSRLLHHQDLPNLSIAHIDCDAFFAAVEKRDNPELADKPVIIGGQKRGVVAAACYVARMYGVRSAMPMYQALKKCPTAVVISPAKGKYSKVGHQIRRLMQDITPLVEPLSIDEAFLDLTGTERLHGGKPAQTLVQLILRIQNEIGISASVGLSYNKFLAKVASDLDKPRGFAIIGEDEAKPFLHDKPVTMIYGVGKALATRLHKDGISRIGQLQVMEKIKLMERYGAMGERLFLFSRGLDPRKVDPTEETKTISAETTFNENIEQYETLLDRLWPLCEEVAQRLRRQNLAGKTINLKIRKADFKLITRAQTIPDPTQMADKLFSTGKALLKRECQGDFSFRLIGIGASELYAGENADPPDLADPDGPKRKKIELLMDDIREKMGDHKLEKGRSLKKTKPTTKDKSS